MKESLSVEGLTPVTHEVVVLSNQDQYDYFSKSYDSSKVTILCDTPAFAESLKARNISVVLLTEFLFEQKWNDVNAWACSRAATWSDSCRREHLFKNFDFPSVFSYYLSHLLIQVLKNYLFAEHVIMQYAPTKLVLFGGRAAEYVYPYADGSYFLNLFLRERCEKSGIAYDWCVLDESSSEAKAVKTQQKIIAYLLGARPQIRAFLKKMTRHLFPWLKQWNLNAVILASGSLRHLSPVLKRLQAEGSKVLFLDDEFHLEKFFFSLCHGIAYRMAEPIPKEDSTLKDCSSYFLSESKKAFALSRRNFVFLEYDFTDFIYQHIVPIFRQCFTEIAKDASCYLGIIKGNPIRALIVEQDYAARASFLTTFMKHHGVQSFCVSHANTVVDFHVAPGDQKYAKSKTFVNSEFEKKMYQSRGWAGEDIIVSGTPRYDRLVRLRTKPFVRKKTGNFKILVCGATLLPKAPYDLGYLGLHVGTRGDVQQPAMRELLGVASELSNIDLLIKPHHHETESLWRSFIRAQGNPGRIRLLKSSDDIFKLIMSCDAMVLAYWSSAILEAAIAKLPTIVINIRPTLSPILLDYSKKGFCSIATSRKAIFDALSNLSRPRQDPLIDERTLEFYLGKRDGLATSRVTEEVLRISCLGKNQQ